MKNKRKRLLIYFALTLMLSLPTSLSAKMPQENPNEISVFQCGGKQWFPNYGDYGAFQKKVNSCNDNSRVVWCYRYYNTTPAGTTCKKNGTFENDALNSALAHIINNTGGMSGNIYLKRELLINKFLYNYQSPFSSNNVLSNGNLLTSGMSKLYKEAQEEYKKISNLSLKITKGTMKDVDKNYVFNFKVDSTYDNNEISVEVDGKDFKNVTIKDNKVTIRKSDLKGGKKISIKVTGTTEVGVVTRYKCSGKSNLQPVLIDNPGTDKRTNSKTIKYIITDNKKPTLGIVKVNEEGETIDLYPATFDIYKGYDCVVANRMITAKTDEGILEQEISKAGNYSIKEVEAPLGYILDNNCHNVDVPDDGTSIEIKNKTTPSEYITLTVQKQDESDSMIENNPATFKIYKGADCRGELLYDKIKTGSSGQFQLTIHKDSNKDKFSIMETVPPIGYDLPDAEKFRNICKTFSTTTTLIFNDPKSCEGAFNGLSNKGDIEQRIALYNKYKARNLLNFNITTAEEACKSPTLQNQLDVSCFSLNHKNDLNKFALNNWSNFNEIDFFTYGNSVNEAFCLTKIDSQNFLGDTVLHAPKSGMLFNEFKNLNNGEALSLNLTKICYMYNPNNQAITTNSETHISDYVANIYFGARSLKAEEDKNPIYNREGFYSLGSGISTYFFEKKEDYSLIPQYSKNGSGKITTTSCSNCKFLGYGEVSQLNDTGGEINFQVGLTQKGNNFFSEKNTSSSCRYITNPEIIDCPGGGNCQEKLNLEFRVIDTNNPFPGMDATGRNTKTNWCYGGDCNNKNYTVKKYINNANNSYNKNKKSPIYEINLTPQAIKEVRRYNSGRNYDDYDMTCLADGTGCTSKFLRYPESSSFIKINK